MISATKQALNRIFVKVFSVALATFLAACQNSTSNNSPTSPFENVREDANALNAQKRVLNSNPVDGHGDFANSTFRVPDYDELRACDSIANAVSKKPKVLDLRFLSEFPAKVNKEDLKPLLTTDAINNIQQLSIDSLKLTDEDIEPIRNLQLRSLGLANNHVRTLQFIAHMTSLKKLCVSGCEIDNSGVKAIAGLPNLEVLQMQATPITDADLPILYRLRKLTLIDLRKSPHLTPPAIRKLRHALPPCEFYPKLPQ